MSTRRLLKAAEAIRGVVSMAILTELRDPRVQNVTVVGVEVTPDMREAKVLVSVMGNEAQQRTVLKGLQNSVGFLQSKISDRIETRYIPRLTFVMDEGVKKSVAVQQILEQISKERESNPTSLQIDPPVESSDALDEQVESETSNDSGGNP
ncbi:MAG: 30S ribosome-binding factor RbfA [Pirellula sp.]|jgi:ribosome-binding factor A